jgi:hypothetical protein
VADDEDRNLFRREFFRAVPPRPQPSPGPWSIRSHWQQLRYSDRQEMVWLVFDAAKRVVAECTREVDALHIAQNGPQADPQPSNGGKGTR